MCQGHVPEPAHHDHSAEHDHQADPRDTVHYHHQEAAVTPGLRGSVTLEEIIYCSIKQIFCT